VTRSTFWTCLFIVIPAAGAFLFPNILPSEETAGERVYIDVPFVQQEKNLCGAACLSMVFKYWGKNVSQYEIAKSIYTESLKGILSDDLKGYAQKNGFLAFAIRTDWNFLKESIQKGRPLIVCVKSRQAAGFHYLVAVGYGDDDKIVYVNDPSSAKLKEIKASNFMTRWKGADYWALFLVPN
jgi:ABC-type bacteriocin/lantibiotic exporter with double-glycine peptidase domain